MKKDELVKNGTGTKADATQTKDTMKGVAASASLAIIPKKEEEKKAEQNREPLETPLDQRVSKIANLQKLTNQLNTLNDTKKDLHAFTFGSDKMKDRLYIEDGQRNRFDTSNSNLITTVVTALKREVNNKIVEIEQQILEATL